MANAHFYPTGKSASSLAVLEWPHADRRHMEACNQEQ